MSLGKNVAGKKGENDLLCGWGGVHHLKSSTTIMIFPVNFVRDMS
jgi:hypothetical protein